MKTNRPLLFFTVLVSLTTLPLGPILWRPRPDFFHPAPGQIPYFLGIALLEAVSFGAGLYFLFEGKKLLDFMYSKNKLLLRATYISISWILLSWWPHDRMLASNGKDMGGLIVIEYLFHATGIGASLVIAKFFYEVGALKTKATR